jgi:dihydrofolate reductase
VEENCRVYADRSYGLEGDRRRQGPSFDTLLTARLLRGDIGVAVRALKVEEGNDLHVIGSPGLVQTLIAHDLIDEMRLMIDPVVLGGGQRLFPADGSPRPLRLSSNQVITTGALLLTYIRASPAPSSRRLT